MLIFASSAFALPVNLSIQAGDAPPIGIHVEAPSHHGELVIDLAGGLTLDFAAHLDGGNVVYEPFLTRDGVAFSQPRITNPPGMPADVGAPGLVLKILP